MKTRKVSQQSLDPGFSLGKKMAMSSDTGFAFLSSKHGLQRRNSQSLTVGPYLNFDCPRSRLECKKLIREGIPRSAGWGTGRGWEGGSSGCWLWAAGVQCLWAHLGVMLPEGPGNWGVSCQRLSLGY